jgi:hypothetical protein
MLVHVFIGQAFVPKLSPLPWVWGASEVTNSGLRGLCFTQMREGFVRYVSTLHTGALSSEVDENRWPRDNSP